MLRIRQQRWDEAHRSFEETISLARGMEYPYAEARSLYQDGLMGLRREEPERARAQLEEALTIFQRLGAVQPRRPARWKGGRHDAEDDGEDHEDQQLTDWQGVLDPLAGEPGRHQQRQDDSQDQPQDGADDRRDHAFPAHHPAYLAAR